MLSCSVLLLPGSGHCGASHRRAGGGCRQCQGRSTWPPAVRARTGGTHDSPPCPGSTRPLDSRWGGAAPVSWHQHLSVNQLLYSMCFRYLLFYFRLLQSKIFIVNWSCLSVCASHLFTQARCLERMFYWTITYINRLFCLPKRKNIYRVSQNIYIHFDWMYHVS